MTAIAEAFQKQGLTAADAEFDIAVAKYLNSGGTIDRAMARLNAAAARMSGMGHGNSAREIQNIFAQTRQPVEGEEAIDTLPQGHLPNASAPSFSSGRDGHQMRAHERLPPAAIPVREPKQQRTPIDFGAASVAIKTKLAQSVMDRLHTSDGRAWGDVGAHELDGMSRDGALALALKNHLGVLSNKQRFKTIRDLVNPETFEAIRKQAHGA